jgi:hypothetical protein
MDRGAPHAFHRTDVVEMVDDLRSLPEEALDAVSSFDGPVLVDFDETLYLRNSTEDFLDSARPAVVALILLKVVDWMRPWILTGGEATRDAWRVGLVRCLFPWTMLRWRRRVPVLASHANLPLVAALDARGPAPTVVVSIGFQSIIEPLLAAMGLAGSRLVASRGWGFADRRRGKLTLAVDAVGERTVRESLAVTDSISDRPLLAVCARPLLTVWPDAAFRPAHASAYLPGRYLSEVKRPGQHHFRINVLQDEFLIWVLASIPLAGLTLPHLAGLFLLLTSFWAIYELGYVDNDLVAHRHEADPSLSERFSTHEIATPRVVPWIWAGVCGAAAICLVRWPSEPVAGDFLAWTAVLVGTALLFRLYNRLDKATRVWLFWGLQLARGAGFAAVVPIVPVGVFAIAAHVLSKWLDYFTYRREGAWATLPAYLVRLMCYLVLCSVALLSGQLDTLRPSSVVVMFVLLFVFKARRQLASVIANARRLKAGKPLPDSTGPLGVDTRSPGGPVDADRGHAREPLTGSAGALPRGS